jgi:cell division protein ZapE
MFPTIFISHIPEIKPQAHDTIILFIRLIDILYDAKVRIIFSAAKPVEQLYVQGKMLSDYARTRSRLLEMQSQDYFLRDAENN